MDEDLIKIGKERVKWNAAQTRIIKYSVEIYHMGLNEHKVLHAPESDILDNKVANQIQKWNDKYTQIESKKKSTITTNEAVDAINNIENILHDALSKDARIDWESIKKHEAYPYDYPPKPIQKSKKGYPPQPSKESPEFKVTLTLFDSNWSRGGLISIVVDH